MNLTYNDFNGRDLEGEIDKISQVDTIADLVNVKVSTTDKGLLFLLGMLFAAHKRINVLNKDEIDFTGTKVDLTGTNKSFYLMSYVWEKLSDYNFPNQDYSNVVSDFDKLIENIKRLDMIVIPIRNILQNNKIFLISPVRDASSKQIEEIEEYKRQCTNLGYKIYVPHLDTNQIDLLGGYAICRQNAKAIASSSEVHIYYDQKSKGSMFDLGVAYYFKKKLVLVNEDQITFNETDFGDNLVKGWHETGLSLVKK